MNSPNRALAILVRVVAILSLLLTALPGAVFAAPEAAPASSGTLYLPLPAPKDAPALAVPQAPAAPTAGVDVVRTCTGPFVPGGASFTCTYAVTNNLAVAATQITLHTLWADANPVLTGFSFDPDWYCGPGDLICRRSNPMPAGLTENFSFDYVLPKDAHLADPNGDGVFQNCVDMTANNDPNNDNFGCVDLTMAPESDASTDVALLTPGTAPGGVALFEVAYFNVGPSDLGSLGGATFVSIVGPASFVLPPDPDWATGVRVPVGETTDATFGIQVLPSAAPGDVITFCSTVFVPAGYTDPVPANNGPVCATLTVGDYLPPADMDATTTIVPLNAAVAGGVYRFDIFVENLGPAPAQGVTAHHIFGGIPGDWQVIQDPNINTPDWECDSHGITCTRDGSMPVGRELVGEFQVLLPPNAFADGWVPGTGVHVLAASADNPDPNPGNNQILLQFPIAELADIAVRKAVNDSTVCYGGYGFYTIEVSNDFGGPSVARNVVVTDPLPAGVTFAGGSPGCSAVGNVVTCVPGPFVGFNDILEPGETVEFIVGFDVDPAVLPGTVIGPNVATVSSPTPDPFPFDNASDFFGPANFTVVDCGGAPVDLGVFKTVLNSPQPSGGGLQFELRVINNGPAEAQNVVVQDLHDGNVLTFDGAFISVGSLIDPNGQPRNCTPGNNGLICNLGAMAPGEVLAILVDTTVKDTVSACGPHTNFATVASDNQDLNLINNFGSTLYEVTCAVGLTVAKAPIASDICIGSFGFYEVTVTNNGPTEALDMTLTDTLPAGLVYQGISPDCGAVGNLITCGPVDLEVGETVDYLIGFTFDPTVVDGDVFNNTATATVPPIGPFYPGAVQASNVATFTAQQCFNPPVDLALDKAIVGPASVPSGGSLTWDLTVANNGIHMAEGVVLQDQGSYPALIFDLPVTLNNPVDPLGNPRVCTTGTDGVVCNLGFMAPGEIVVATVAATARRSADACSIGAGQWTNFAAVASNNPEDNTLDNIDFSDFEVDCDVVLDVGKMVIDDQVCIGSYGFYELTVTNDGPTDAIGVVVQDTIPAGLTLGGISPDCSAVGTTVTCGPFDLAFGETADFLIGFYLDPATVVNGTVFGPNVAEATAAAIGLIGPFGPFFSPGVDFTAVQCFDPPVDLQLDKTANPAAVTSGDQITFDLTVTNASGNVAVDTVLQDQTNYPALQYTLAAITAGSVTDWLGNPRVCTTGNDGVVCALGAMGPNESLTVTVFAEANETTDACSLGANQWTNYAVVAADNPDTNFLNNEDFEPYTVNCEVNLTVEKSVISDEICLGAYGFYEITVTNDGPTDAIGVTVEDTLPFGLIFGGASPECSEAAGVVTCGPFDLAVGDTVDFLIGFNIDESLIFDGDVVGPNQAVANAAQIAPPIGPGPWGPFFSNLVNFTAVQCYDPPVDLVVDKKLNGQDGGVLITSGDQVQFTIEVTNPGLNTAVDVQLHDAFNAPWINFLTADVQPLIDPLGNLRGCTVGVDGAVCTLGAIGPGETVVVTLDGDVSTESEVCGPGFNQVVAISDNPELNFFDNIDFVDYFVQCEADLEVTKTASPDPVVAGDMLEYTILVTNDGPTEADDVVVVDTLDPNVTFDHASPNAFCSPFGQVITCNIGDIPVGGSFQFSIWVTVNAGAPLGADAICNQVDVTSNLPDPDGASFNTCTDVNAEADLWVEKTDSPDPVIAGTQLTYFILVHNDGPSDAGAVEVVDVLPSQVSFVSYTATFGACVHAAGVVTCNYGPHPVGAVQTITITVDVDANVPAGSNLFNEVDVATDAAFTSDPALYNNHDEESTLVWTEADVSVVKTDSPDPVIAGTDLTYTIVVSNGGPSDAWNVLVLDQLPPQVQWVSTTADPGVSCGGSICSIPKLDAFTSKTITIVVHVPSNVPFGTQLLNSVCVTSYVVSDPDQTNNCDTETTTVDTEADLSILKEDILDPVYQEGFLWYNIVVSNDGPSDAAAVMVEDFIEVTFPSQPTAPVPLLTSSPPYCVPVVQNEFDGTYDCDLGIVGAGESVAFQLIGPVPADTISGTLITDVITVTSTTFDPVLADNDDDEVTEVIQPFGVSADLETFKFSAPVPVTAGTPITFSVVITNNGVGTAIDVDMYDPVPAGFLNANFVEILYLNDDGAVLPNYFPFGGCDEGTSVHCEVGDLWYDTAISPTWSIINWTADIDPAILNEAEADLIADPSLCVSQWFTNTAYASSDNPDYAPDNNVYSHVFEVEGWADLAVDKVASVATVIAGQPYSYTITVHNYGPSDSQMVMLEDTLPLSVDLINASDPGCAVVDVNADPQVVMCELHLMPVGSTRTIVFTVMPDPAMISNGIFTATDVVEVWACTPDQDMSNNSDTVVLPVDDLADLWVDKTDNPDPVVAGTDLVYDLTVTNDGPSDAQNVVFEDDLSEYTRYLSYTDIDPTYTITCQFLGGADPYLGGGHVKCTIAEPLAAGDSATVRIKVHVQPDAPRGYILANEACAMSTDPLPGLPDVTADPDPSNNCDVEETTVIHANDMGITKDDTPDPVLAGEMLTFDIVVTNYGPSDASQVWIEDTLPPGVHSVNPAPSQGTCSVSGYVLTGWTVECDLGYIALNHSATVQIQVIVDDGYLWDYGNQLYNFVRVWSDSDLPDPDPAPNSASTWTTVGVAGDLGVRKHDIGYDPVQPGGQVTYNVEVCNYGPSEVLWIEFEEDFSAGLKFLHTSAPNCNAVYGQNGGAGVEFTCLYIGLLDVGQCFGFEFVFEATAAAGETVENCVAVSSPTTPDPTPNMYPNSDCEDTMVSTVPTAVTLAGFDAASQNLPAPLSAPLGALPAATGLALALAYALRRRR